MDKKNSKLGENKTVVKTFQQLTHCLDLKIPFSFHPALTSVQIPYGPQYTFESFVGPLDAAVAVTHVTIPDVWNTLQKFKAKERDALTAYLAQHPRITHISFAYYIDSSIMDSMIAILKTNPRIISVEVLHHNHYSRNFQPDKFKAFCDNMKYYNIQELVIKNATLPIGSCQQLVQGLTANRTIKKLKFWGLSDFAPNALSLLCPVLVSKKITEFWFTASGQIAENDVTAFKQVLQANHLRKLTLESGKVSDGQLQNPIELSKISKELKMNNSITDLTFIGYKNMAWKLIEDLIAENKNIKRLELTKVHVAVTRFSIGNASLKELILDITVNGFLSHTLLFKALSTNTTLRKLHVSEPSDQAGYEALDKFFATNTSLKELKLHAPGYMHENISLSPFMSIIEGLKVNRSLRKISFTMRAIPYDIFAEFIEALKINTALTELHMNEVSSIILDNNPPHGKEIDDYFLDLLKTNKTLRFIAGASEYPFLEKKLKENRDTQDRIVGDICTFIKILAARSQLFLNILPLEIWLRIFSFISLPFCSIDFAQYCTEQFQRK